MSWENKFVLNYVCRLAQPHVHRIGSRLDKCMWKKDAVAQKKSCCVMAPDDCSFLCIDEKGATHKHRTVPNRKSASKSSMVRAGERPAHFFGFQSNIRDWYAVPSAIWSFVAPLVRSWGSRQIAEFWDEALPKKNFTSNWSVRSNQWWLMIIMSRSGKKLKRCNLRSYGHKNVSNKRGHFDFRPSSHTPWRQQSAAAPAADEWSA